MIAPASNRDSSVASSDAKAKLAVWKFASCDGCQLSLLDCEDELLLLSETVTIAHFLEATRARVEGPYDLSLVEGSITTAHDRERIQEIRRVSKRLVTIGACATAGGIQALRNFADIEDFKRAVYAHPEYIDTLANSTAISTHVPVDFELRGCPVNKRQLLEVVLAMVQDRKPEVREHSVCIECKKAGTVCLLVAGRQACLGPVTHAGCGALCPRYARGCFGCYGPSEQHNTDALQSALDRVTSPLHIQRLFSTFNVDAQGFVPAHRLRRTQPSGRKDP
jgi:sulfhydrogenase subunit delta